MFTCVDNKTLTPGICQLSDHMQLVVLKVQEQQEFLYA